MEELKEMTASAGRMLRQYLLLSFVVAFAAAANNTTVPVPDAPLILFSSNPGGGGGGGAGGFAAALAQVSVLAQEVVIFDATTGAVVSVEGAVVNIPSTAFSGAVEVKVTMIVFNAGTSVVTGVVRAPVMRFSFGNSQVLSDIDIVFIITFRRRQVAKGNDLIMNWLNKKTNVWTPICAPSSLDPVTGEFTTATPAAVLNDPAFNPSSGCAPDLLGSCDGSGGEFTVFEMSSSTCSDKSGASGLSDGAIAGIVIGVLAGITLIAIGTWLAVTKTSKQQKNQDAVLSSLVLGQEEVKVHPPPEKEAPAHPPVPFLGGLPVTMPPSLFGGSPPVMPMHPPYLGGSPPVMTVGMPTQSYPLSGGPLGENSLVPPLPF